MFPSVSRKKKSSSCVCLNFTFPPTYATKLNETIMDIGMFILVSCGGTEWNC